MSVLLFVLNWLLLPICFMLLVNLLQKVRPALMVYSYDTHV
jgi:hypothetical protein